MLKPTNLMRRIPVLILGVGMSVAGFSECAKVAVVIGSAKSGSNALVNSGQEVPPGTKIRTQPNSFVKLILRDGSIVDIGPSSVFTVSSCAVNNQVLNLNLELELGKVRANVIKTEKMGKRELNLKTPTSLLGVRGTEFFVSWEKDASGRVQEQISVSHGQIEVRSLFDKQAGLMSLSQGTELKAEGRIEKTQAGVKVREGSAAIDQFTATEQKTFEINTKVEQNPFEAKVDLKKESEKPGQTPDNQNNSEGFVVATLSTDSTSQTNPGSSSRRQNPPQSGRIPPVAQTDSDSTTPNTSTRGPNPPRQIATATEVSPSSPGRSSQPGPSRSPANTPSFDTPVARPSDPPRPTPVFNFDDVDGPLPGLGQIDTPLTPPTRIDPSQLVGGIVGTVTGVNNIGFVSVQGIWGAKKQ